MRVVTCPFCQEKGRIPASFIGKRIKCGKCNNRFLVTPPPPKSAPPSAQAVEVPGAGGAGVEGIEVEGLAAGEWASFSVESGEPRPESSADLKTSVAQAQVQSEPAHAEPEPEAPPPVAPHEGREYKLLTQKDKFFGGKFELPRLEEAINHYALQGWRVRAMTTAQVAGFSGGAKEELVVLLER